VVVYDNASSDNTRAVLEQFRGRVELIYDSENRGFCGGHNAVISKTRSDFVLLVNPDVVMPEDYIDKAATPP
jgi:GT2 family glycosyltransferase